MEMNCYELQYCRAGPFPGKFLDAFSILTLPSHIIYVYLTSFIICKCFLLKRAECEEECYRNLL